VAQMCCPSNAVFGFIKRLGPGIESKQSIECRPVGWTAHDVIHRHSHL